MSHRYGRHGPRGWKRLQERKYVYRSSVLPVPVVSFPMSIQIIVPATTERVIVIIMSETLEPIEDEKTAEEQANEQALQMSEQNGTPVETNGGNGFSNLSPDD